MRVHGVVSLLLAVMMLASCQSSKDTSGELQGSTPEGRKDWQAGHAGGWPESRDSLDALDVEALKKKDGQRITGKGKVYSTHLAQSGRVFTLNLGPDWKTCFKAVIFRDDFEKWKDGADGIKTAYDGKTVVIEGKVKVYKGSPEIVVNTPSQIEVVQVGNK